MYLNNSDGWQRFLFESQEFNDSSVVILVGINSDKHDLKKVFNSKIMKKIWPANCLKCKDPECKKNGNLETITT